jgi:hypothetical protein
MIRCSGMKNIFLRRIRDGSIRSLEDLKGEYHRLVMRTHPDAVGSDDLVESFIAYSGYYEEAKKVLARMGSAPAPFVGAAENYRLLFYREFYRLERIDKPYAFNKYYVTQVEIRDARQHSEEYFAKWRPDLISLYRRAQEHYDLIKKEKPRGPYMKYAMLFNLSPVFHNILSYQMTGLVFYKKQLKQNLAAVLSKLEERDMTELVQLIQLLIDDMDKGPAILGVN